jgi:8-oxo-dGTP diphosphatase
MSKTRTDSSVGIRVTVGYPLGQLRHQYACFAVSLHPFVCPFVSGQITLHEHAAFLWVRPEEALSLGWSEADISVIENYLESQRISCGEASVR